MHKGKNILVTSTPGVGKTTFCEMLQEILNSKVLGYKYLCIGKLVNEKKLYKTYNKEFDVPEFDEDMVCEEIKQDMEARNNIFEFHSSAFFPEDWFDLVVLLRTNNTILYDQLKARNYVEKNIGKYRMRNNGSVRRGSEG